MDINNPSVEDIGNAPRYFFPVEYIFTNRYMTVDAFLKDNFSTGFHEQSFFEINLIAGGEGFHALGDRLVPAQTGDVFIIPPHHKHAFVGGEGFNCYHFLLSPVFFEKHLTKLSTLPCFSILFEIEPLLRASGGEYHHLILSDEKLSYVLGILDTIHKNVYTTSDRNDTSMLINESAAIIAIATICEEYGKQIDFDSKDRYFIESIVAMTEKYNEKLTVDELSEIAHMSRTSYLVKFKNHMGITPRQFLLNERIRAAKRLLSTTDKRISGIAEQTGFFDTSHFIKTFVSEVGMSPTQYRQEKTKG